MPRMPKTAAGSLPTFVQGHAGHMVTKRKCHLSPAMARRALTAGNPVRKISLHPDIFQGPPAWTHCSGSPYQSSHQPAASHLTHCPSACSTWGSPCKTSVGAGEPQEALVLCWEAGVSQLRPALCCKRTQSSRQWAWLRLPHSPSTPRPCRWLGSDHQLAGFPGVPRPGWLLPRAPHGAVSAQCRVHAAVQGPHSLLSSCVPSPSPKN